MRPRSAGGCPKTTCQPTTTSWSTAGGCQSCREATLWAEREDEISVMTVLCALTSDLRLGKSPSQEDGEDSGLWRATDRVFGASTVVCDLDPNSLYAFRVRSCRNSMFSPYSPEVTFHTPPAPGESTLHFFLPSFLKLHFYFRVIVTVDSFMMHRRCAVSEAAGCCRSSPSYWASCWTKAPAKRLGPICYPEHVPPADVGPRVFPSFSLPLLVALEIYHDSLLLCCQVFTHNSHVFAVVLCENVWGLCCCTDMAKKE